MPTITIAGTPLPMRLHKSAKGNDCFVLAKKDQSTGQAFRYGCKVPHLSDDLPTFVEVDGQRVDLVPHETQEDKVKGGEKITVNGEYRNFTVSIRDTGEGWNVVAKAIPVATGGGGGQSYDLDF